MQKIRMYARAIVFFLFDTISRVCRSSALFKRAARVLLRFFPKLAQFYMRVMTRPAPLPSQRMLTPHAVVILSDLKTAITQLETKIDKAPQSKGR